MKERVAPPNFLQMSKLVILSAGLSPASPASARRARIFGMFQISMGYVSLCPSGKRPKDFVGLNKTRIGPDQHLDCRVQYATGRPNQQQIQPHSQLQLVVCQGWAALGLEELQWL